MSECTEREDCDEAAGGGGGGGGGGEAQSSGCCELFVPRLVLTCAACGQPAAAHACGAYDGVVAALEDALRTAGSALATLRGVRGAGAGDAATVAAVDGLVRGVAARLDAALDALVAPERARAREAAARQQRAERRARVLAELVATEDEYAHDLATLLDVWRPALAAAGVLDARQTALVFREVPQLLYLARTLAAQLRAVAAKPLAQQDLGAALLRTVPFMRVYVDQCAAVPRATELLRAVASKPQYIQAQSVCSVSLSLSLSLWSLDALCSLPSHHHCACSCLSSACSRIRAPRASTSPGSSSSRPSGSRSTRSSSATSSRPPSPVCALSPPL